MLSADDVLSTRFTSTKFAEGYDQGEVDDFLDRVTHTLRAAQSGERAPDALSSQDVRDARFQATRFREGYAQDEVDDFLDRVVETLANLEDAMRDAPHGTPVADAPPPPPPLADAPRASEPHPLLDPPRPWIQRLFGR